MPEGGQEFGATREDATGSESDRTKREARARLVGRALILKRQRSQYTCQAGDDTPSAITAVLTSNNALLRSSCYVVHKSGVAFHSIAVFFNGNRPS